MASGEVVMDRIALDRHLDPDRDHAFAAAEIPIDIVDRLPGAVGQFREALSHGALDVVLHLSMPRVTLSRAVFLDQPQQFALGGMRSLAPGNGCRR